MNGRTGRVEKESADVDESDLLAANEVDYCVDPLVVTKNDF